MSKAVKGAEHHRPFSFYAWRITAFALGYVFSFPSAICLAEEPPTERLTLHPGVSYAAVPGNQASVFAAGEIKLGIKAGKHLRVGPTALLAFTDRKEQARDLSAGVGIFLRAGGGRMFAEASGAYLSSLERKSASRTIARCSFGTTRHLTHGLLLEPQVFVQFESASGTSGDQRIIRPGIQLSLRKDISGPR
ncbi:MAG: hypothetical protein ACKOQY_03930 [Bacteroidota bacterium]